MKEYAKKCMYCQEVTRGFVNKPMVCFECRMKFKRERAYQRYLKKKRGE